MIKYLGSKRALIEPIVALIGQLRGVRRAIDLFSGSARVGHALKARGLAVIANDDAAYAEVLARCHVQADSERWEAPATQLLRELGELPGEDGYFTRTFCEAGRFFQPHNGRRIDRIRRAIAEKSLDPELEAILLTSLIEAADRVDSTTGVHMAYLKSWAPRSYNDLVLRLPVLLPRARHGQSTAMRMDALEVAPQIEADVAYVDPPYNQHKYSGNYHVWETLVRNDAPATYGVAMKRVDCKVRQSPFNSRRHCQDALYAVLEALRTRYVVLSLSNEGFVDLAKLRVRLAEIGRVEERVVERPRYVGARIGIHDPNGRRVGKISHLTNCEHLFLITRDKRRRRRAAALAPLQQRD